MSTPVGTKTAPAGKGGTQAGKTMPSASRPFITGTREVDKSIYDETRQMLSTGTVNYDTYELDTDGFTSDLYLLVQAVTAGNTATVAFNADAPLNTLNRVLFSDTSNKAIIGPMTLHDLYECVKHGGYAFSDDAKTSPVYSTTPGGGATGGSYTLVVRVPIEIVHRDALGSLLNKSASAVYKWDMSLAVSTDVYSTPPTALPTVRVRISQFGWMDPNSTDIRGNAVSQAPPALNTVQYWDKQSFTLNAGNIAQKLNTFSGMARNIIFECRDSTQSRAQGDLDWPDPFTFQYETSLPVQRIKAMWQHLIGQLYGYNAAVDSPGGRDNGIYPLAYNKDFGLKPGAESRFGYLPVSSATALYMKGFINGSGTHSINVFVNYVNPANGDPRSLTGGR